MNKIEWTREQAIRRFWAFALQEFQWVRLVYTYKGKSRTLAIFSLN